jgi:hypothetical protein
MLELIFGIALAVSPAVFLFIMVTRSRRARDKAEMARTIHRSKHFECPQGEYCDESLRSCKGYKGTKVTA